MVQLARLRNEEQAGRPGPSLPVPGALGRLVGYPRRVRLFLHEVRNQMKLVTWPGRREVYSTTIVVLVTVAFFALFFWMTDSGLGYASQWLLKNWKR
jgi:preprotein translocase subunit SecE